MLRLRQLQRLSAILMKIIGQLWATGEKDRPGATTIQLKRRQKRVRVHKYCQLAEFGHRWQPGLIAYLATIGTYRPSLAILLLRSGTSYATIDRSIADSNSSMGIELHLRASCASTLGGSLIDQTVTIWHLRVQSKQPLPAPAPPLTPSLHLPLPLRSLIIL